MFELRHKPTTLELAQPIGMLDLHEETGLVAIKECGLLDEFLPLTGDCAPVMKMADKDGNAFFTNTAAKDDRPEISRNALNQLLISKLPVETIKWGHKLLSATSSGDTEVLLDFGDHGKQAFDLVIGADGAWSKVRSLLSPVKPHYSGRQIATLTIRQITEKYPQLVELIGPGTFFAIGGDGNGVTAQRGSGDSARLYIFISTPDGDFGTTSGLANRTGESSLEFLLDDELLGKWGPKVKELVTIACEEESKNDPNAKMDIRPVYSLPTGFSWESTPVATLIGDAAHVMPPSGEGVNIAMFDAVMLSRAVIKAYEMGREGFRGVLSPLMKEFEIEMTGRATEAGEQSANLNRALFAEDGAKAVMELFKEYSA